MSTEVVHIAGVDVQVGSQLRQRCSWCGAVLLDYDLANIAVPTDQVKEGENIRPATWPPGALVLVDGGFSTTVEHKDGDQLPKTACAQLPHDITGMREPA